MMLPEASPINEQIKQEHTLHFHTQSLDISNLKRLTLVEELLNPVAFLKLSGNGGFGLAIKVDRSLTE